MKRFIRKKKDKPLGIVDLVGLGVGGTIGSGIFIVPAVAAGMSGPTSLIAWVLCAISFGAVLGCLTVLSRKYAVTGAFYSIFDRSFSRPVATTTVFLYIVSGVLGIATIAAALGDVVRIDGVPPLALEIGLVVAFGLLNLIGIALAARVEDALTVIKILPLLIVPLLLFPFIDPGNFTPLSFEGMDFLKCAVVIYWCFTGFELSAIPSKAVRDPEHTVPRSLIYVFVAVTVIYLALNFALMGSLGPDGVASTMTPITYAIDHFFSGWGVIITVIAVVSMISALNAYLLGTSLVLQSFSEKYWKRLTFEHKGVPVFAVILCTVATSILLLVTRDFSLLASASVIATLVPYLALCCAAMINIEKPLVKVMAVIGILATGLVLISSFLL
ncbi:MAG TPA: APC family permease [Methanocella sp.]